MIKFLEHGKTKMAEENENWRKVKRFCYFPLKHFLALASGSELISECVPYKSIFCFLNIPCPL